MSIDTNDIIEALVHEWVQSVAPTVRVDCCILAARTTSLVLDYYGITNKVLACEVVVFNEAALEQMQAGNDNPEAWPLDAWSIGVGRHSPGNAYAGHLVVRVGDVLVDLSAAQFHRPGRIDIDGPRVWPIDTINEAGVYVVNDGTAWLGIKPGGVPPFRGTKDWRYGREVAAVIINAINNRRGQSNA